MRLRACCATHSTVGFVVAPVGGLAGYLHQEQNVDAGQADGVDVYEVTGQDAFGLGGEELGPRWSRPSWCRTHTGGGQDRPDGAGREPVAQASHLALDAPTAPGRVVPGQPQHQLAYLGRDRRSTPPPSRVRPPPRDQIAVPAQQRGRGDEERRPPGPRQQPRQAGKHRPVDRFQIRTAHLPTQDRDLVPQHEHLDRVGVPTPGQQDDQLQCLTKKQVAQRQDHDRQPDPTHRSHSGQSRTSAPMTEFSNGTGYVGLRTRGLRRIRLNRHRPPQSRPADGTRQAHLHTAQNDDQHS